MEEEITRMFLQGITLNEFKLLYLAGTVGIVVRFLLEFAFGVRREKFQIRKFFKGFARVIAILILMAFVIARFQEFSHLIVTTEFSVPTRLAEGVEVKAGITAGTAFFVGMGMDDIAKRLSKKVEQRIKARK